MAERVTACDSVCTQKNMPMGLEDGKDLTLDWDERLPLSTPGRDMNKEAFVAEVFNRKCSS